MSSSSSTSVDIPSTAADGALTITQPPQTATSYFKIAESNTITFAWNFTNLYVTPTYLTVSAVCDNGNTYPVGPTNGIINGTATSVTWDLWSYQQANPSTPLAVATYTLSIWGDSGPSVAASPGYLAPNSDLQFAMYSPQPYTPLSEWSCSGCNVNGAWSTYAAHPAFVSLVATIAVMFLSGYALLRQALH
ncbi:uncharacterized protein LAESUDRAFT_721885 [Laetiporus sulphureus 93-53]|uniref:DUF7137 domain-containing protein n=1 Tax=Laetiporus sulphureus 93-53 TaxID=1314785 RepID=A0A165GLA0_9APHY|nr:uncharacterized protein LAESUDRAFT_721885 [Laetiporus sulphureus 93-53]KZT10506.1 hypothetical protein LAESUDRAFT_721885 [Laetiporus sulphureus 93-53]